MCFALGLVKCGVAEGGDRCMGMAVSVSSATAVFEVIKILKNNICSFVVSVRDFMKSSVPVFQYSVQ